MNNILVKSPESEEPPKKTSRTWILVRGNLYLVASLFSYLLGIFLLFDPFDLFYHADSNSRQMLLLLLFMLASVLMVLSFLSNRIESGLAREKTYSELTTRIERLETDDLKNLVDSEVTTFLGDKGKSLIQGKIALKFDDLVDSRVDDLLSEKLKVGNEQIEDTEEKTALEFATAMDEKFLQQVLRLNFQQYLSLIVGLAFAMAGGILLFALIFGEPPRLNPKDTIEVVSTLSARIVGVVFIEIFAFFFLRNYRMIFSEIRHYQQLRNQLQGRIVALQLANTKGMIEKSFDSFINLPEEKRLTKEESTESIEREKLLLSREQRLIDLAEQIVLSWRNPESKSDSPPAK